MCINVSWENSGNSILCMSLLRGETITSLDFKNKLRNSGEKAFQNEVGEWLRDKYRERKGTLMEDYSSKSNGIYVTYYLSFWAKVRRFFKYSAPAFLRRTIKG